MAVDPPPPSSVGFDGYYGLEIVELGDGFVRGRVPVSEQVKQPLGLVHGGVYASVGESLARAGTIAAVGGPETLVFGLSTQTSFLRPITADVIDATARARHRGRTTWVWEVEIADGHGRLCVLTRVTVSIVPRPSG